MPRIFKGDTADGRIGGDQSKVRFISAALPFTFASSAFPLSWTPIAPECAPIESPPPVYSFL